MGAVGDTIFATPVFENLRIALPFWKIDVIIPDNTVALYENNIANINSVIAYPSEHNYMPLLQEWRFFKKLYLTNYQNYICVLDFTYPARLPYNLFGSIVGFVASVPNRYGIYRQKIDGLGFFEKWIVDLFMIKLSFYTKFDFAGPCQTHLVENRLNLLKLIGIEAPIKRYRLHVDPTAEKSVDHRLEEFAAMDDLLILFCSTSSVPSKQWSPLNFAELGSRLNSSLNAKIIIGGAPSENSGALIHRLLGKDCLNLSGEQAMPSLSDYVSLCKRCRICVGLDSGLTHIAAAISTPVVMLFGSTAPHLSQPLPVSQHRFLHPPKQFDLCPPCPPDACPLDAYCINQIDVDTVYDAVLSLLKQNEVLSNELVQ
jgi:ADP-heptose:LPS heptosyltransferase